MAELEACSIKTVFIYILIIVLDVLDVSLSGIKHAGSINVGSSSGSAGLMIKFWLEPTEPVQSPTCPPPKTCPLWSTGGPEAGDGGRRTGAGRGPGRAGGQVKPEPEPVAALRFTSVEL